MTDWPDDDVLRKILELPGVAGETMAVIEKYLEDPQMWWEREILENAEQLHLLDSPEGAEAVRLRRQLNAVIQGHWSQLCW